MAILIYHVCLYIVQFAHKFKRIVVSQLENGVYPVQLAFNCATCRAVAAYLKVVRRRKSSSAEATRWGRAREGDIPPLVRGVCGASPEKIFEFLALLCALLTGFVCVWDQILVVLVTKIFLDKIVFRQSHVFFLLFFSSACFFDIISSMSLQVLAKYF